MRITVDLPDDLHRQALTIARDTSRTMSDVVTELMRRGLGPPSGMTVTTSPVTGLPVLTIGRPITTEDVRSLNDDS